MYPNYDRKNNTSRKIATLTVVAMGIISLLAPPYLLSTGQEAFAEVKNHDKNQNGEGNEIPPGYITIDGEVSELQFEVEPSPQNPIADYTIESQGTLSFDEHFSLLLPQAAGVLKNAESSRLLICFDPGCGNDDLVIDRELVNVNDEEFLYVETYLNRLPDDLGDGFTANEEGFEIYMWWTVEFTDGTDQTYVAIVHLQGDDCEEHGWIESGTRCFQPEV